MKTCTKCDIVKSEDAYYKDPAQGSGLRPDCKACISIQRKARYAKDPLGAVARTAAWRKANPAKYKQQNHDSYWDNAEERRVTAKAYHDANKDTVNAKRRKRNATDPAYRARINEATRQRLAGNPEAKEAKRRSDKKYYENHYPKIIANVAAWRRANPDKVAASAHRDHERHKDRCRLEKLKRRAAEAALPNTITNEELLEILEAHSGLCYICKVAPFEEWDHVIPVSKGGGSTKENLRPTCFKCNRRKGAKLLPCTLTS